MTRRMTKWVTEKRQGLIVGFALMVAIVLVDVGLVSLAALRHTVSLGTFTIGLAVLLSLGLLGMIVYWLYGLSRSIYLLDRNALIIQWGPLEQTIPAKQIERVLTGDEVEGHIHFYGGFWPGHCVGYGEVPGAGPTLFYGTDLPRHLVYVVTPGLTYGLSPADREGFLAALRQRVQMGSTQVVEESSRRPGILDWAIWQDRLGLILLGVGILAIVLLIGLLCFRLPMLPRLVPLHFDLMGNPDRLGLRWQIFIIPLIGLLALALNGVLGWLAYRRERMISYLLWGGAVLVQVLVWTAAIGILARL
jgi:hypothetical protein